jgi:DNA mismatch endonuclease (patch repair protein)
VHGCFWHQHPGCGRQPKSRLAFWRKKLFQNRERDLRNQQKLRSLGWRILIVWECVFSGFSGLPNGQLLANLPVRG